MVYEDIAIAKRGRGVFERVEGALDEVTGFEFGMWRLEALSNPDFCMSIISEAVNADVVVLAMHTPAFTRTLWKWLEIWAEDISDETALVVLFDNRHQWEHFEDFKGQLHELIGLRRISLFVEPMEVNELSPPMFDAKKEESLRDAVQVISAHTASTIDSFNTTVPMLDWSRGGINE